MRRPIWTIFYQFDPWGTSIGGIQTAIRACIRYAPEVFDLRLVGTAGDDRHPVGRWRDGELDGRQLRFLPLFVSGDDNVRRKIPTTLTYTAALLGKRIEGDFLHFHRLEPALAARGWSGEKTYFVHNDVRAQMLTSERKDALLWQRFPSGYFALERQILGDFDQILSCNSESTTFYRERYPRLAGRIHTFRYMLDTSLYHPPAAGEESAQSRALAAQMGLEPDTRFLLFAGRLHAQKDPLLLLRAVRELDEPGVHLLMAGAGELEAEIRHTVGELGLADRVSLLGPVPRERMAVLHRASTLVVLSSVYEGLPLVVLEALSSGKPVVSTASGDTPRILVSGSGLISRERTPTALADALRTVLHYPSAFPAERCLEAARPYQARTVVGELASEMLDRFQTRRTVGAA
ncbi:glycosyltransferase family 4 protein [Gloeobacter morelensis]|uniref:Glycosyltransferase family 4 protein n=1 Tax=Gloeobacter morelensis MG652769 TaxID=2781736 RepID=A0ABY3PSJ3_9CYAN|nr:glycosyltransferase family 4 protein [Gloeobacter morelensis]UFP96574.1 glycosyltransferase family 4 protein [Gloeobacter morelensis MG652769]